MQSETVLGSSLHVRFGHQPQIRQGPCREACTLLPPGKAYRKGRERVTPISQRTKAVSGFIALVRRLKELRIYGATARPGPAPMSYVRKPAHGNLSLWVMLVLDSRAVPWGTGLLRKTKLRLSLTI
jgi:hypothetical protein